MNKSVFNKIFISIIVAVILINWTCSYIVLAESQKGELEDIIIEEGSVGGATYKELKKELVEDLRKQLEEEYNYSGTVEELAEACDIDLNDSTAGDITTSEGKTIKIDDNTTIVIGFKVNIVTGTDPKYVSATNQFGSYTKITMSDVQVVKNTGTDNTSENNGQMQSMLAAIFTNEIIVNGKVYFGNTDWEVGGVLLKELFYLVNCVADTLLGALQKIMYSDVIDANKTTNFVKTQYIDKLRVVDSRNIDTMFALAKNKVICVLDSKGKISHVEYPHIHYSPEEIFSGQISVLNIDFISGEGQAEGLGVVRKTIASWYKALRLIGTIGFLSVLIYMGIKIMLSANTKDKAKYKQLIIDWLVGFAMLYAMHYVMAFIISIITQFNSKLSEAIPIISVTAGSGYEAFNTNLIGLVRFCTQFDIIFVKIGYEIMYILLVGYTFKFTVIYLKRVLTMAFLTVVAPIIAFTYPIDKSIDGKATVFSTWMKDYVFNALLQPMHYLLYYIMVSSSMKISVNNPLYAIAVLAFMMEAEKLFKKIFGFDKASKEMVGGLGVVSMAAAAAGMKRMIGGRKQSGNATPSMPYPGAINTDYKYGRLDAGNVDFGYGNNTEVPQNGDFQYNPINTGESNYSVPNVSSGPTGRPRLATPITPRFVKRNKNKTPIHNLANKVERTRQNLLDKARGTEIGQMAMEAAETKPGKFVRRVGRGFGAIGKRTIKPIWDSDQNAKYNGKRLIRNVAKGTLGIGLGITAAAVQAGISLTDGKYNPAEAVASFAAGYALAGRVVDGTMNTFESGYREGLTKEEKMEQYKEMFRSREDVIQFCKENWGDNWKEYRERIVENYVERGFIDLKEIKQCIKYSDKVAKEVSNKKTYLNSRQKNKTLEVEKDKQDAVAMYIVTQKKNRKRAQISLITYDNKKENSYLQSITQGKNENEANKIRRRERNISASIRYFDKITSS